MKSRRTSPRGGRGHRPRTRTGTPPPPSPGPDRRAVWGRSRSSSSPVSGSSTARSGSPLRSYQTGDPTVVQEPVGRDPEHPVREAELGLHGTQGLPLAVDDRVTGSTNPCGRTGEVQHPRRAPVGRQIDSSPSRRPRGERSTRAVLAEVHRRTAHSRPTASTAGPRPGTPAASRRARCGGPSRSLGPSGDHAPRGAITVERQHDELVHHLGRLTGTFMALPHADPAAPIGGDAPVGVAMRPGRVGSDRHRRGVRRPRAGRAAGRAKCENTTVPRCTAKAPPPYSCTVVRTLNPSGVTSVGEDQGSPRITIASALLGRPGLEPVERTVFQPHLAEAHAGAREHRGRDR